MVCQAGFGGCTIGRRHGGVDDAPFFLDLLDAAAAPTLDGARRILAGLGVTNP